MITLGALAVGDRLDQAGEPAGQRYARPPGGGAGGLDGGRTQSRDAPNLVRAGLGGRTGGQGVRWLGGRRFRCLVGKDSGSQWREDAGL